MKNYRIPKENRDLKKYAVWKNLKYLLFFLLYELFLTFAFLFYLNRRYEDAEPLMWWVYLLFGVFALVSGWLISCMTRFLFDRSVSGKIRSFRYLRSYGRGLGRQGQFSLDEHTFVQVVYLNGKGKKKKIKFLLFDDGYDGYYKEGYTLVKFRGLNYPLCLESEQEGAHLCTVCGVRTYYKEGKVVFGEAEPEIINGLLICRSCRHTLINTKQLLKRGAEK